MSAILAGHVTQIRTMADGSPRLTVDFACTLAELVAVVGGVGQSVAVAALAPDSQPQPPCAEFDELADSFSQEAPGKGGSRARQAAMVCHDAAFQRFACWQCYGDTATASETLEQVARACVLDRCGIRSRAELDNDDAAWRAFGRLMAEFRDWKNNEEISGE